MTYILKCTQQYPRKSCSYERPYTQCLRAPFSANVIYLSTSAVGITRMHIIHRDNIYSEIVCCT